MEQSEIYLYTILPSGKETFGTRVHRGRPQLAGSLAAELFRVVPVPEVLEERLRQIPLDDQNAARMLRLIAWCKVFVSTATRPLPLPVAAVIRRLRAQVTKAALEAAITRRLRTPPRLTTEETQVIEAVREASLEPRLDRSLVFALPHGVLKTIPALVALSTVFGVRFRRLRASAKGEVFLVERKRVQRVSAGLTGPQKKCLRGLRWRLDQQVAAAKKRSLADYRKAADYHKAEEDRGRFLEEAKRDLRRLSRAAWWQKWNEKTHRPRGKPRQQGKVRAKKDGPLPQEMVERTLLTLKMPRSRRSAGILRRDPAPTASSSRRSSR